MQGRNEHLCINKGIPTRFVNKRLLLTTFISSYSLWQDAGRGLIHLEGNY